MFEKNRLKILKENNYYPFGLKHGQYNDVKKETKLNELNEKEIRQMQPIQEKYKYEYNGKEFQGEFSLNWSDYGARNYDASLGRWVNLDALAEIMYEDAPFSYSFNNPVFFIDTNGSIPWPVHKFFNGLKRRIASWYGPRKCTGCSSFHRGLDINFGSGFDDYGAPVLATHPGRIVSIKNTLTGSGRNIVIQSYDGSLQTLYFHLSSIDVVQGQDVSEGQIIGKIGASGRGKEKGYPSHLHYAIKMKNNGKYQWFNPTMGRENKYENIIDPMNFIIFIGPRNDPNFFNNSFSIIDILFNPSNYAKQNKQESITHKNIPNKQNFIPIPNMTPKSLPLIPKFLPTVSPITPTPILPKNIPNKQHFLN